MQWWEFSQRSSTPMICLIWQARSLLWQVEMLVSDMLQSGISHVAVLKWTLLLMRGKAGLLTIFFVGVCGITIRGKHYSGLGKTRKRWHRRWRSAILEIGSEWPSHGQGRGWRILGQGGSTWYSEYVIFIRCLHVPGFFSLFFFFQ